MSNQQNGLLTREEVCDLLCHSQRGIQHLEQVGKIPRPQSDGQSLYYDENEIAAMFGFENLPRFVDVPTAAQIANVKKATIRTLAKNGKIRTFRITNTLEDIEKGVKYLFLCSDIERLSRTRIIVDSRFDNREKNYKLLVDVLRKFFNRNTASQLGISSGQLRIMEKILFEGKDIKSIADSQKINEKGVRAHFQKVKNKLKKKAAKFSELLLLEKKTQEIEDENYALRKQNAKLVAENWQLKARSMKNGSTPSKDEVRQLYSVKIQYLDLSTRAQSTLKKKGIQTLGGLQEWTLHEIKEVPYCGEKTVRELQEYKFLDLT